jgi:hypothetical protein
MYYLEFVSDSRKSHNLQDGPSLAETPTGQQKGKLKLLNPHNHCNFCIVVRAEAVGGWIILGWILERWDGVM